jgi:ketosteroid isomerase-like protein
VSENLDLIRSIYADWERGDFTSVDWAEREIEFVFVDGPSPGTWTGRSAMAEVWRDWLRAWDQWRTEPDEYRELENERVLVLVRNRGRGKTSGLELGEIRTRGAGLFHLRGGKVTRFVAYWDRERAFAALGLQE